MSVSEESTEVCPNCDSRSVRTEERSFDFKYGVGADASTLTAVAPVHICDECGTQYTDHVGERARHAAVCAHLGLLTPEQIVAIRDRAGMNRRQFAIATRIGLASLARWENAESLQNPALDRYLRLLDRDGMADSLRILDEIQLRQHRESNRVSEAPSVKFPAIASLDQPRRLRLNAQKREFRFSLTG